MSSGWDNEMCDATLRSMLTETLARVTGNDPVQGDWCVDRNKFTIRVDASSLAMGVTLEANGAIMVDACWFHLENDTRHIELVVWKPSPYAKECVPMLPSHCAKGANSMHANVIPKPAWLRVVIWGSSRHVFSQGNLIPCPGFKASGFEKYADDRPSCQNIQAFFYAKIQPGKGIKIWVVMIASSEILVVYKITACIDDKEKRKRSLCFVLPRKTTLLLTLTHSLFCFILICQNFQNWGLLFISSWLYHCEVIFFLKWFLFLTLVAEHS